MGPRDIVWPIGMDYGKGIPSPLAVHPDHGGSSLHAGESNAGGPVGPPCWQRSPPAYIYLCRQCGCLYQAMSVWPQDIRCDCWRLWGCFGVRTNLSKCSAHLIRCSVDMVAQVDQELGCPVWRRYALEANNKVYFIVISHLFIIYYMSCYNCIKWKH
jgi:hypothetical protein